MPQWTKRSAQVMSSSLEEAVRRGSPTVYPEHLLIALVMNERSVASNVLRRDLQLDPTQVVELIDEVINSFSNGDTGTQEPKLSTNVHKALHLAYYEARRAGHHYIGTEHLLLGLVGIEDQTIEKILGKLNHSAQTIRLEVHKLVPEISPQVKFGDRIWYRLKDDFYQNMVSYVPPPILALLKRFSKLVKPPLA